MNKVLYTIIISIIVTSCNNEIDVIDEVDSKPVVYSLLNLMDTAYSVSLTKTFIGLENIYTLASNTSTVFYPSADVRLEARTGDKIIWSTSFYQSEQIKEEGIFPSEPGYLYYSNSVLSGIIDNFKLIIDIPSLHYSISASVPVYKPCCIINPGTGRKKISLFGRGEVFTVSIGQRTGSAFRQLNMKIRYFEKLVGSDELEEKEQEFIIRTKIPVLKDGIFARIPGDFFLNKLVANIPTVNDLQFRRFIDFDLILYSADEVYKNYTEIYVYTTDLAQPGWSNKVSFH